ncbi:hypothetical protein ACFS5L_17190 [Streptomyces phyllanthi]|uniref:Uncharacterized protein n=1 Tax=Streptomyces phyllanthi TaxID=1803180 RepID=A0A5N8VYN8_9ACTN|nr:hypothetical protein [Streptomyces phyllanthi]MPY40380.1 hypothetical protein [Streptomyces phyllanthi]
MTSSHSARPLIAIIGSADPHRTFSPPLKAADLAPEACRQLGMELARAGCDLAVFSSSPEYIETDVVAGYAEACSETQPGRVAAYPPRHRDVDFGTAPDAHLRMEILRDTSGEWEVAFYHTLLTCDGVLLMGGGQSTRVAGIIALAQRLPLVPVASFGGGAGQVWVNFDKVRNDADDADIRLMGDNWSSGSAARLVACLLRQRERKLRNMEEHERGQRTAALRSARGLAVSAACMVVSLVGLVTAGRPQQADVRDLVVLVGAPLAASAAGAILRNSFESDVRWGRAAVRGLGAGLVSVLLYFASQLLSVPSLLDDLDVRRLLFFTIPLGFTAGFTFDVVFERLRSGAGGPAPVQPPDPLAPGASRPPSGDSPRG